MAKPQAIQVPSDDCAVQLGGVTYYPHEGESIWILPGMSVGEIGAYRALLDSQPALAAARGERDELNQHARILDDAFERMLRGLCQRITDWDWTNNAGQPMPKPIIGDPEPLRALDGEELVYIVNLVVSGGAATEGKGSPRSRITSLDTAPTTRPRASSSARNRGKASSPKSAKRSPARPT